MNMIVVKFLSFLLTCQSENEKCFSILFELRSIWPTVRKMDMVCDSPPVRRMVNENNTNPTTEMGVQFCLFSLFIFPILLFIAYSTRAIVDGSIQLFAFWIWSFRK